MRCLYDADQPLWKNRIHEQYEERFDDTLSVQTIGRRVDSMHDAGLVESCILSPDNVNRDLIIGYMLTDTGRDALARERRDILLDAAQPTLFRATSTDTEERPISKTELVDLLCDEFQLDGDTGTRLEQEYSWDELTVLAIVYLVKHRAINVFTDTDLEQVADIISQSPEIADVFAYNITSPQQS